MTEIDRLIPHYHHQMFDSRCTHFKESLLSPMSTMSPLFVFFLLFSVFLFSTADDFDKRILNIDNNEWMWLDGSNMGNQLSTLSNGSTGRSLLPSGRVDQLQPGSRGGVASWRDSHGNMWMFGGSGYDSHQTESAHTLNDLWMFNSTTLTWKVVHAGSNGSERTRALRSVPSPRWGAAACGVDDIMLVIFGGEDAKGMKLYDTWVYEIKLERWLPLYARVRGGRTGEMPLHPAGRADMTYWCHRDKFIIFTGLGHRQSPLDDMWLFSLRTLRWNNVTQFINTREVAGAAIPVLFPEPRAGGTSWTSQDMKYYLFGGNTAAVQSKGFSSHTAPELTGDMWRFSLSQGNVSKVFTAIWTHIHADDRQNGKEKKHPGPRQHCASWVDLSGYLWLFGGEINGEFTSDIWKYKTASKTWSLESSPESVNHTRLTKGQRGHLLSGIHPDSRCHAIMWTFGNITFLFGGYGLDARGKVSYLNDFWLFVQPLTAVPNYILFGDTKKLFHFAPHSIFWICLGTFGGIALVFGAGFFIKKMLIDYPQHNPNSGFNVRYSPLKDETNFEMW